MPSHCFASRQRVLMASMPLAGKFPPSGSDSVIYEALIRTVESTLRTMNNLIERLHASFFFYILTSPSQFLKIGLYLPSAILISIAVMIYGLSAWVDSAWIEDEITTMQPDKSHIKTTKWKRRKRPVIGILFIMMATHALGAVLFALISSSWYIKSCEVQSV
jgi:glycosylphosphatidylinositol transamidase